MSYKLRQLASLAFNVNAFFPPHGRVGAPAFFAGWMTNELTPQLMTITAADTAQHLIRRKATLSDLALAATNLTLMSLLVRRSQQTSAQSEESLISSLGPNYREGLGTAAQDNPLSLSKLVRPLAVIDADVDRIRDVEYNGPGMRGRLDVFRPSGEVSGAPVLLQVHGGAWIMGRKEEQGLMLINKMVSLGWVCVSINYRLAPKHLFPAQIIDVKKAIAWVRDNIAQYGGDASHLVITGGSAGGHLASLAALSPNDPEFQPGFENADTSVDACVPFYGVFDLANKSQHVAAKLMLDTWLAPKVFGKPFAGNEAEFEKASPLCRLDEIDPELIPDFYVLHGDNDTLVDVNQARSFVARLREVSHAMVTYTELRGAQHAFELFTSLRSHQVIASVARWLEWQRLHGSAADTRRAESA